MHERRIIGDIIEVYKTVKGRIIGDIIEVYKTVIRRIIGDIIEVYKTVEGFASCNLVNAIPYANFENTGGHLLHLFLHLHKIV